MVPEESVQWYRDQRTQGFTREELIRTMRENGYTAQQMKEIIVRVEGQLLPIEEMELERPPHQPPSQPVAQPQPGAQLKAVAPVPGQVPGKPAAPVAKPMAVPAKRLKPRKPGINLKLVAAIIVFVVVLSLIAAFFIGGGPELLFTNITIPFFRPPCMQLDGGENEISESVFLCSGKYENSRIKVKGSDLVVDCKDAALIGMGSGTGVSIENVENVKLKNCIIENFGFGVQVKDSRNVVVSDNDFVQNSFGVTLDFSNNVMVSDNTMEQLKDTGIVLSNSKKNVVSGNTVKGGSIGVHLKDSSNNLLSGNTVMDNNFGVVVKEDSTNNVLMGNTVCGNSDEDVACETPVFGSGNMAVSVGSGCEWLVYDSC